MKVVVSTKYILFYKSRVKPFSKNNNYLLSIEAGIYQRKQNIVVVSMSIIIEHMSINNVVVLQHCRLEYNVSGMSPCPLLFLLFSHMQILKYIQSKSQFTKYRNVPQMKILVQI